jgi:hypothetical protein
VSTLEFREKVCSVCGARNNYAELANVSIEVPIGIDGHPGETDALSVSLNFCPSCGYAAEDITQAVPGTESIVNSPPYQKLIQKKPYTESVLKFVAASFIAYKQDDIAEAITMLTKAVWMGENHSIGAEQLSQLRRKTIDLMLLCRSRGDSFELTVWQEAQSIVEFLRREGQFDDALDICRTALKKGKMAEDLRIMLKFEEYFCRKKDREFKVLDDFYRFKKWYKEQQKKKRQQ